MNNASHEYTKRIDRVIDYLRDNLDQPLKLEDLAKVACFSQFHFHRVFLAMTGETLHDFSNRLRLEKAARVDFFEQAKLNTNAHLITGVICGYRVEEIENVLTQQVRYLDKLVDELAKGRKMEKILRVA